MVEGDDHIAEFLIVGPPVDSRRHVKMHLLSKTHEQINTRLDFGEV